MLKGEESQEQSSEIKENMASRTEYYLESLITDAFKGKGFQKINELFEEKEIYPPQKYSKQLFNQLDKVLKKELDKNEFQNVSLLLKCIQMYFKSDPQEGASLLIQQGLIPKMVSWFERAREFLILIEPAQNKSLLRLVEDFFDSALVICKCNSEGKKQLLDSFLPDLGQLVTETNVGCALRQEALRTLNSMLDSVPREERRKFPMSEEMCSLTKDLAKTILEVGDYDLQVALSEALCRLITKKWRDDLVHNWFEDDYLAEAFKEIKDREFETDCRKFLNQLNDRLGDKKRVYSFPCISAFADMEEVKKPSDEKLEEFWIDFNAGSQSVSFYIDSAEGALWDSVRLPMEVVSSYSLREDNGEKIVKIYTKNPTMINGKEVTKIKIHFNAKFDILNTLYEVLGKDKMMIKTDNEDLISPEEQTKQNGTLITNESSYLQWKKDSTNIEKTDSLSDILTSQYSDQSHKTSSGITTSMGSQQTETEDAKLSQECEAAVSQTLSAKKSKTPSPKLNDKTSEPLIEEQPDIQVVEDHSPEVVEWEEKKNRRTSLGKEIIEAKMNSYDFENSSDSLNYEKVTEAKQKVLGQKVSLQNQRSHENGNMKRESSKLERRPSDYRKHLFSESNRDTASNSHSEKSWILDSQQKSLPKTLDYTRRRPRVRSKLKVLPLSSASSGSDYHTKKVGVSRPTMHREVLKKEIKSSAMRLDFSAMELPDDLEADDLTLPLSASSHEYSDAGEKTKYEEVSSKLPGKDKVSKFKRKGSDLSPGGVVKKPKLSRWEMGQPSPGISPEPRKLFDSIEKKKEIQTGVESDESDDIFVSKILHEDVSDSGVIAAFESFTSQLTKTFWSRYKRMEICAKNALKTSEKSVSALLNQIHQCRLNKLENFHKVVVQELANLEKDAQILSILEKDTVDFWNKQSIRLSSFCNHQKQRIQSMDSVLEETTRSFKDTIQNTKYEHPQEKVEENSKVFVVASD
ncbi:synaptonemal complex protein 2-like isoform X2 [Mauremys reevesii]|uniref:synaptonemal complex protein 2-like isoform X2 n=1 Tax=Mauremys reevesii TaxID=260615 RepID=UPI00193F39FE|nr:synaptonemal complex protein 2-like isoform X2 [Mauremys reevesii]